MDSIKGMGYFNIALTFVYWPFAVVGIFGAASLMIVTLGMSIVCAGFHRKYEGR